MSSFSSSGRQPFSVAERLSQGSAAAGYRPTAKTETNQIFAILPNAVIETLRWDFGFYVWETHDATQSVIRLVASWVTAVEAANGFLASLPVAEADHGSGSSQPARRFRHWSRRIER